LGEVAAIVAGGDAQPAGDRADQRLVAAQQLFQRAAVLALRGEQQRPFVKRGAIASSGVRS